MLGTLRGSGDGSPLTPGTGMLQDIIGQLSPTELDGLTPEQRFEVMQKVYAELNDVYGNPSAHAHFSYLAPNVTDVEIGQAPDSAYTVYYNDIAEVNGDGNDSLIAGENTVWGTQIDDGDNL
ncbi:MAG: hypothetical protein ACLQFR_00920 [Streptosporangiaceae bacterium]